MKAFKIYEALEDVLKPLSKDEIYDNLNKLSDFEAYFDELEEELKDVNEFEDKLDIFMEWFSRIYY